MNMFSILNTKTGDIKVYHDITGIPVKTMMLLVDDCAKRMDKVCKIVLDRPLPGSRKKLQMLTPKKPEKSVISISRDSTKEYLRTLIERYDLDVKHTRMGRDKMYTAVVAQLIERDILIGVEPDENGESIPLAGTVLILHAENINEMGLKLSQAVQKQISFVVEDYYVVTCGFVSKAGYEKGVCDLPTSKTGF